MNSIYKTTTWIVIIVSACLIFFYTFAIFTVASAGHNSGNTFEIFLFLLYLICLPISLYTHLNQNTQNTITKNFSIILLLVGIIFCSKELYENSNEGFGLSEYLVLGTLLTLQIVTLIGLFKKRL